MNNTNKILLFKFIMNIIIINYILKMNRRKFLSYVGCGCCSFISSFMLSTAPITDRKQLTIIPESKLNAQAAQIYEKIKEKEKMSDDIAKCLNEIKLIGKNIENSIDKYF